MVALQPKSVSGWINRARLHSTLQNWAEAKRDYDAAIELTPLDKALYLERSEVQAKQTNTRKALRDYATHLELNDGIIPTGAPCPRSAGVQASK